MNHCFLCSLNRQCRCCFCRSLSVPVVSSTTAVPALKSSLFYLRMLPACKGQQYWPFWYAKEGLIRWKGGSYQEGTKIYHAKITKLCSKLETLRDCAFMIVLFYQCVAVHSPMHAHVETSGLPTPISTLFSQNEPPALSARLAVQQALRTYLS